MARFADESALVLGIEHKSVPPRLVGRRAIDVAAERRPIRDFPTPLLTLDRTASDRNVATVLAWAAEHGFALAPHGKTTMAPVLWRRLLEAGAWGLTLATPWQARVARAAGVGRILIANEVVDPAGLAWLASETDEGADIACWVDSVAGVRRLARGAGDRPLAVLVEVGAAGGRTGARGLAAALEVARAVREEPRLELRGVSGYEGVYGHSRDAADAARVGSYLRDLAGTARAVLDEGLVDGRAILTAGGSAWLDLVADILGPFAAETTLVLRSGAFQAHDDLYYAELSPFAGSVRALRPALTLWARVLSRPEPGLALLDAGKRDVGSDAGYPVPLDLPGARIVSLNDQHAYLELPGELALEVGEVVRLGISHPCTTFDRWRLIPEVDDATSPDPRVIAFIETIF